MEVSLKGNTLLKHEAGRGQEINCTKGRNGKHLNKMEQKKLNEKKEECKS